MIRSVHRVVRTAIVATIGVSAVLAAVTPATASTPPALPVPSDAPPPDGMRWFEAENGTIAIPEQPQRIVACGYSVLPLLQAGANLVAICENEREIDDMPDDLRAVYEELPKVGPDGDASAINYEGVAAAEPDLIIMGVPFAFLEDLNMDTLEDLAPVLAFGPRLPGDWREVTVGYADAAGVSDVYAGFVEQYEARAAEVAERYAGLARLTFGGVCTTCPADAGTFRRSYASGFPTNLLDDLGFDFPGHPADPNVAQHGEYLSLEQLGESFDGIDVIVYGVESDGSIPEAGREVLSSPLWEALPAVQAGNVVAFEHSGAATHLTAILALDSIDEQLAALPAFVELGSPATTG